MSPFRSGYLLVRSRGWIAANGNPRPNSANVQDGGSIYRGVDRAPIRAIDLTALARSIRRRNADEGHIELAASLAMGERQKPNLGISMLPTLDDARDVYCMLSRPRDWELLWAVEKNKVDTWGVGPEQSKLIGFDVVNFPWSFKSALRENLEPLQLNCDGLFDELEEAQKFASQYNSNVNVKTLAECSCVEVYGFSTVFHSDLLSPVKYSVTRMDEPIPTGIDWLPGYSYEVRLLGYTPKTGYLPGIRVLADHTSMTFSEAFDVIRKLSRRLCLTYFGTITKFEHALIETGFDFQSWQIPCNSQVTNSPERD